MTLITLLALPALAQSPDVQTSPLPAFQEIYLQPVSPTTIATTSRSYSAEMQARRAQYEPIIRARALFYGVPADIMIEIARCESGFQAHKWNYMNPTGNPHSKWSAYGLFQVIASHEKTFGVSRLTLEGNIEIAMRLYLKNGTRDWNESRGCWGGMGTLGIPTLSRK